VVVVTHKGFAIEPGDKIHAVTTTPVYSDDGKEFLYTRVTIEVRAVSVRQEPPTDPTPSPT
jgi:hypothetical protein